MHLPHSTPSRRFFFFAEENPMVYRLNSCFFFFAPLALMALVISMIMISSRYQPKKPLPTVIRMIPSGSGRSACPSCVINGKVAPAISTVMIAPFHQPFVVLAVETGGLGCTIDPKNFVASSNSISGTMARSVSSIAASVIHSLVIAT